MIKRGDILTLEITETNLFARGVARAEGMVVFCRGAVEGDVVRAAVTDVKKNYAEADCVEVLKPSDDRSDTACPHAERCGGCPFSHVTPSHEAKVKKQGVAAAFRRAGVEFDPERIGFIDTPHEGYRNKTVFHFDAEGSVGFFAAGSNSFVKIENCFTADGRIVEIAKAAEKILKEEKAISPSDLTYLYIRYMKETDEATLSLGYRGTAPLDSFAERIMTAFPSVKGVLRGSEPTPEARDERLLVVRGASSVRAEVAGISFDVGAASFFQVNTRGAEALVDRVAEFAALKDGERAADIYCGAGLFSLALAKSAPGAEVYGIEKNPAAVASANRSAAKNGVSNAFFLEGDSAELSAKSGVDRFDVAVVDPPRTGLSPKTIEELRDAAPERIVYVSCNPATLARDVKLLSSGYTLAEVTAVNMFPRTGHCEVVCKLLRSDMNS